MTKRRRLIIGMSGASGLIYGVRLLEQLRRTEIETHLVISKAAEQTRHHETALSAGDLASLADVVYPNADIGAAISSGSFKTLGMIVVPCSMSSLAQIATGVTDNLLARAADVVLKERRRLVLVARETPLHAVHLKNMLTVTEMGGIIAPPVPAFYIRPQTLDDIVNHTVGRILDLFDIETDCVQRWGEETLSDPIHSLLPMAKETP